MSENVVREGEWKDGTKRAWMIVVGLGFLMGAGLQQILANAGNFIPFICAELQCDPAQLTFWITMYAIFMAISQPFVGRIWPKVSTKIVTTVAFLVSIIALALMGTYTEVWQFWVSGAVIGLSGGFYFMVAAPYMITNWFAERTGFALGMAGIIGGILAVILSPIDAALVAQFGWRTAYFIVAIISCVMALPFTLFVFEFDPAKVHMHPAYYNAEKAKEEHIEEGSMPGIPEKRAVFSIVFVCIFIVAGICALFGGFQNLYGFAAAEWGFDATFTSLMISATSLFTIMGPFIGIVIDKIGPWKTSYGVLAIVFLGGVGFLFVHGSDIPVLIWCFMFAFQGAVVGTLVPLLTRDAFGAKAYTKEFSYMQIGMGLIGGFSNPVISGIFTHFGTFNAAIIFGMIIVVVSVVLLVIAQGAKSGLQKKYWED